MGRADVFEANTQCSGMTCKQNLKKYIYFIDLSTIVTERDLFIKLG